MSKLLENADTVNIKIKKIFIYRNCKKDMARYQETVKNGSMAVCDSNRSCGCSTSLN